MLTTGTALGKYLFVKYSLTYILSESLPAIFFSNHSSRCSRDSSLILSNFLRSISVLNGSELRSWRSFFKYSSAAFFLAVVASKSLSLINSTVCSLNLGYTGFSVSVSGCLALYSSESIYLGNGSGGGGIYLLGKFSIIFFSL